MLRKLESDKTGFVVYTQIVLTRHFPGGYSKGQILILFIFPTFIWSSAAIGTSENYDLVQGTAIFTEE